jgi:hypothetical protein
VNITFFFTISFLLLRCLLKSNPSNYLIRILYIKIYTVFWQSNKSFSWKCKFFCDWLSFLLFSTHNMMFEKSLWWQEEEEMKAWDVRGCGDQYKVVDLMLVYGWLDLDKIISMQVRLHAPATQFYFIYKYTPSFDTKLYVINSTIYNFL